MIKKKKILSLLLLCLFISIFNVSEVKGFQIKTNYSNKGSANTPGNPGNSKPGNGKPGNGSGQGNGFGDWSSMRSGNKLILYRYSVTLEGGIEYNVDDVSLNGGAIKSGTWIGINAYENQWASWDISNIESKEVRKVYTCKIKKQVCVDNVVKVKYDIIKKRWITKLVTTCNDILETKIENEDHDYYDESPCKKYPNVVETSRDEDATNTSVDVQGTIISSVVSTAQSMVGEPLSKVQITTDELNEKNEYKTLTILGKLDSNKSSFSGYVLS